MIETKRFVKSTRIVFAFLLALTLAVSSTLVFPSTQAHAAYKNTGKSFTLTEGGVLGIGGTKYVYKIFKEDKKRYKMYHNLDVCPAIYHTKNVGDITLKYSKSKTYSSQTAYKFSKSVGLKVPIAKVVELTAGVTHNITHTIKYSVSASNSVVVKLPAKSKTGYYKMTICHNYYKYRADKYKSGSSTKKASYYEGLPYGKAYVGVLYASEPVDSKYKILKKLT
jgi:hypothetical protein